jgi:hypothetical protein
MLQVHLVGEPLAGLYSRLRDLGADDEVDADAQELEDKAMVVLDVGECLLASVCIMWCNFCCMQGIAGARLHHVVQPLLTCRWLAYR